MKYERETNCGIANIEITRDKIKIEMEKFGDCAAYKFISDMMSGELLNPLRYKHFPLRLVKIWKGYECGNGPNGCIKIVGECLESFLSESKA